MAGGVKAVFEYGRTDDYAYNIVEDPVHIRDLNATILHLLGLDENRLRFLHAGRLRQLTNVGGARVLTEIVA